MYFENKVLQMLASMICTYDKDSTNVKWSAGTTVAEAF